MPIQFLIFFKFKISSEITKFFNLIGDPLTNAIFFLLNI